jgi:hypothetical protein
MITAEQKAYIELLDLLQQQFEICISNYALDRYEDLNDQDYEQVVRVLYFSRGVDEPWIVITPYGHIRATSKSFPLDLLVQIVNTSIHHIFSSLKE